MTTRASGQRVDGSHGMPGSEATANSFAKQQNSHADSSVSVNQETPAEDLRNALQLLAPWLADYGARGDDPAALWSIEDTGHAIEAAEKRIRRALEKLERPAIRCPSCRSILTEARPGVLRCIWCGFESRAEYRPTELGIGALEVASLDELAELAPEVEGAEP